TLTVKSSEENLVAGDITAGGNNDATLGAITLGTPYSVDGIDTLDITSAANAKVSVDSIDTALTTINDYRASVGALQNRMEYTVSNLSNINENMNAARSQILDADFAKESANLARTQVLQQAGMSMLSQANQQSQNVLQLLQ
ncbi:flagellin FliC, partial [Thiomicrorhabdus sp. 6S2-11]